MIAAGTHTVQSVTALLSTVSDPEIPVISITELGIVRHVSLEGERVTVTITPTYSGCPAMKMIEDEIRRVLSEAGLSQVVIETVYAPAWTTDWMDEHAKAKLKEYGIAPPLLTAQSPLLQITLPEVHCPRCGSEKTQMKSAFGSTACKAYYFCDACRQAFEHFKSF
jgi:ring-1,2-phenylacetyl-CoA epoxidase subunit PaaD